MYRADDLQASALAFLHADDNLDRGTFELVPESAPDVTSTCRSGRVEAIAGRERLALADEARSSEFAVDMAESISATNSAELALAHQMAAAHRPSRA